MKKEIETNFLAAFPCDYEGMETFIDYHIDYVQDDKMYVRFISPSFPEYTDNLEWVTRDYAPKWTVWEDKKRNRWYASCRRAIWNERQTFKG